ncbi:LysR family transcriptional regulator [Anaerofilum sp. An201]|nr:LysR family transcriptional regulator [Anaerofilum sp. An201]OUP00636.1 LysR family transcriptional regulator [Anaerofilum sp. An201]
MELRVLQYFLAVAREQSISAAAQSLHLSQPTLSTQLKGLEEGLGKQLLVRGRKGSRKVTLTEEGMILRKRAEEILKLVQKAETEIMLSDDNIAGDICIGAGETQIIRVFAKAAQALQKRHPNIHYQIFSGNAFYVMEQLDKGLIDFGLVYDRVDLTKYEAVKVPIKDVWGVLMRKDSPLAQKQSISPEDLWDKPLLVSAQKGSDWIIKNWIKKDFHELNIVAEYNLLFNASLLTSEGFGYAICFDNLVNTQGDSNLCFRPLSPRLEAEASIVWKKYQFFSKAAALFLKQLEKCLEQEKETAQKE